MRYVLFWLTLISLLLGTLDIQAQAQRTLKKKDPNKKSAFKKAYHNMTGRYNAYYHAGLLLDKSFEDLEQQYQEDFSLLLPLYPYVATENTQTVKAPLDEAIKKLATNIELHRISQWVDDSYLLIGQCEFLKKDYGKAKETFKFIVDKYNPNKERGAMNKFELELAKKEAKEERKEEIEQSKKKKKNSAQAKRKAHKKKMKQIKKKRKQAAKKRKKALKKRRKAMKKRRKGKSVKKKPKKEKKEKSKRIKAEGKISFGDPDKKKKEPEPEPEPEEEEDNIYTGGSEDEEPEKYTFKHAPNRYESMIWMVRAMIELKEYNEAGLYLRLMATDGKMPYHLRADVQATMAHWHIAQKEYEEAKTALEKAIELSKKRRDRCRYAYILAQLHEQSGNFAAAEEYYYKSMRWRRTYDMEFNARLNMARSAGIAQSDDTNGERILRKMLKDAKNQDYKDQIYYALAEIQLRNGSQETAIATLKQSMAHSQGFQRTETSYLLGELFYERQDYVDAYNYYDTCGQSMKKTDERLAQLNERKERLKDVAINTKILIEKDSMLTVAAWDYSKQREWAMELRKAEKEQAKAGPGKGGRLDRLGGQTAMATAGSSPGGINKNAAAQSKFPLYNPNLRKKGQKEFQKRWGMRAYGDNWRLSSEAAMADVDGGASARNAPLTEEEVNEYLKKAGVPLNDKDKEKVHGELQAALFKLGAAYREQLQKNEMSKKYLARLIKDYPSGKFEKDGLYLLYLIALDQGDSAAAARYKKLLLEKDGDSDIAKILKNPNYLEDIAADKRKAQEEYKAIEDMIAKRNYAQALESIKGFDEKHKEHGKTLKPKLALMQSICIGGTEGEEKYVQALKGVVVSFPDTPEEKEAKSMLKYLNAGPATATNNTPSTGKSSGPATDELLKLFEKNMETGHYVLVAYEDPKINTTIVRQLIDNYNKTNYSLLRLNASPFLMDNVMPTLQIRKFKNGAEAMEYYNTVSNDPKFLGEYAAAAQIVVIGQGNYRTVLQKRNFKDYLKVFSKLYLED